MSRLYVLLLLAAMMGLAAISASGAASAQATQLSSSCATDSSFADFTFMRAAEVLDPLSTDADELAYRAELGLTGVSMDSADFVQDTVFCSAALDMYASSKFAGDSVLRKNFRSTIGGASVLRLTPNRFVLNAGIWDEWYQFEQYVFDSSFVVIEKSF